MKANELQQIIKEELYKVLNEQAQDYPYGKIKIELEKQFTNFYDVWDEVIDRFNKEGVQQVKNELILKFKKDPEWKQKLNNVEKKLGLSTISAEDAVELLFGEEGPTRNPRGIEHLG